MWLKEPAFVILLEENIRSISFHFNTLYWPLCTFNTFFKFLLHNIIGFIICYECVDVSFESFLLTRKHRRNNQIFFEYHSHCALLIENQIHLYDIYAFIYKWWSHNIIHEHIFMWQSHISRTVKLQESLK